MAAQGGDEGAGWHVQKHPLPLFHIPADPQHTNEPNPPLASEQPDLRVLQCSIFILQWLYAVLDRGVIIVNSAKGAQVRGLIWLEQKTSGNLVIACGTIPLDGKNSIHPVMVLLQTCLLRPAPGVSMSGRIVAVATGYARLSMGKTGRMPGWVRGAAPNGCWARRDPVLQGDPAIVRGTGGGVPFIAGALVCWSLWACVPVHLSRGVFSSLSWCRNGQKPDGEPLLSACGSWHSHKEWQRGSDVSWAMPAAESFAFHPFFSRVPVYTRINTQTPLPFAAREPPSCRAATASAVPSSPLSFALSCFDLLGVFLLFAIAHESLGKSKQFISHVYYLLDGQ